MDGTCEVSHCNNEATTKKVIEAPFSMSSTMSDTRKVIEICDVCADQDTRMAKLNE